MRARGCNSSGGGVPSIAGKAPDVTLIIPSERGGIGPTASSDSASRSSTVVGASRPGFSGTIVSARKVAPGSAMTFTVSEGSVSIRTCRSVSTSPEAP